MQVLIQFTVAAQLAAAGLLVPIRTILALQNHYRLEDKNARLLMVAM